MAIFNDNLCTPNGMSPCWILLELRVMEAVMSTGAVRRAKLQSNHHHQQTNTQLFIGRMTFLEKNTDSAIANFGGILEDLA